MIEQLSLFWQLLTIVFTDTFVSDPFFLFLILFVSIFATIFIFMKFFDGSFVKRF